MRFLLSFVIIILGWSVCYAQEQRNVAEKRVGDPKKFDEYGIIEAENEMARLDNIAIALRSEKDLVVYFYYYAGRRTCVGMVHAHAERAIDYLVNQRRVEKERIIWKEIGYREKFTVEVWVQPRSAVAPYPSPTVDKSKVIIRKKCKLKY